MSVFLSLRERFNSEKDTYFYLNFLNSFTEKQFGNLGTKELSCSNVETESGGPGSVCGRPVSFVMVTASTLRPGRPLRSLCCDFQEGRGAQRRSVNTVSLKKAPSLCVTSGNHFFTYSVTVKGKDRAKVAWGSRNMLLLFINHIL